MSEKNFFEKTKLFKRKELPKMPKSERNEMLRKAADLLDERVKESSEWYPELERTGISEEFQGKIMKVYGQELEDLIRIRRKLREGQLDDEVIKAVDEVLWKVTEKRIYEESDAGQRESKETKRAREKLVQFISEIKINKPSPEEVVKMLGKNEEKEKSEK